MHVRSVFVCVCSCRTYLYISARLYSVNNDEEKKVNLGCVERRRCWLVVQRALLEDLFRPAAPAPPPGPDAMAAFRVTLKLLPREADVAERAVFDPAAAAAVALTVFLGMPLTALRARVRAKSICA